MISKSYSFVNSLQDSLLQGLLTCLQLSKCSAALVGWAQRAQDSEPLGSGCSCVYRRGVLAVSLQLLLLMLLAQKQAAANTATLVWAAYVSICNYSYFYAFYVILY